MPFSGRWGNVLSSSPRVGILLLNWNGWKDTIECLESIYRLKDVQFRVVVCDNDSHDGSLDRIEEWARGDRRAVACNPTLSSFISPPIRKPVVTRRFENGEISARRDESSDDLLTLIQTGTNLGFAGGNNCGLRYFLTQDDCDYVWLLNNDTIASPDSLAAMVTAMQKDTSIGIMGSQLRDYAHPSQVQVHGGKFYSVWSARVHANLEPRPTRRLDYVDGASMLVRRAFLEQAGLMDERYFLYFEELDWSESAKRHGFGLDFVPESVVFHKEGASSGTNKDASLRGLTSERFLTRNRILFTRRYHAWALPTVVLWILLTVFRAVLHRDWKRANVVLRAIVEGVCLPVAR
ncbi:glycosyltransferase family 2 protein [Terriglobus sp. ADX1]|uniref:glycosyltransferase family 2 protein n=1 Tax=Terriglobus sp. ADX1 TaxID=2794063 RepID=UPI002FE6B838